METALALPDFALALTPDEYQLPPVDPSWNENVQWSHMGRNHVNPDQRQNSNIRNARGKWKISPTPFAAILWRLRSGIFILMVSCQGNRMAHELALLTSSSALERVRIQQVPFSLALRALRFLCFQLLGSGFLF
ncbi:hypothetical protein V6N13_017043 [Hibiscus sabdariffa]